LLLTISACVRPPAAFRCTSSDQCTSGGVCQPIGLCSFDDAMCPNGQRYGAASGDLSGVCVGAEPDGGPTQCNLAKPFGSPVLVAGIASTAEDASLRLSPDEKTAFFFSARSGTKLLYTATRTSVTAPFSNVSVLANVNTDNQYNPSISADGLTLFFASYRSSGIGDNDIYEATRKTLTGDFTNIRPTPNVNTAASEVQPYIAHDGNTLYFVRTLPSGLGVFRATGSLSLGFTSAGIISAFDGPTNDSDPVPSADGLTMYWASDRPGGTGDLDIWEAHRATISGTFGNLQPVSGVNTIGLDAPSDVSEDGCRLYLTSTRAGKTGIYVASRPP